MTALASDYYFGVDDAGGSEAMGRELLARLEELMSGDVKRRMMADACRDVARLDAAENVAGELMSDDF